MRIGAFAGITIAAWAAITLGGCTSKEDIDQAIHKAAHPIALDPALRVKLHPARPLDGNGDERLTSQEVARWIGRDFKQELERADNDGDAKLSAAELTYARTSGPGARIRSSMDANKDGVITLEEHTQFVGAIVAGILQKYDKDGDGAVSEDEFLKVMNASVVELDGDKNGVLDRAELRAGASPQPRARRTDLQYEVMLCAPICVWDLPAGIYDGDGDVTDQDGEDSPDHPGHGWRRRVGQLCLPVARPVRALLPQVIGVAPYGRSPGAL